MKSKREPWFGSAALADPRDPQSDEDAISLFSDPDYCNTYLAFRSCAAPGPTTAEAIALLDAQFPWLRQSTFAVFCDDFVDEVSVGQTWDVTVVQGTDLVGTKFNPTDYPALFWLAEQDTPASYVTTQLAMWSETDPTFAYATMASNNLLAEASANQGSVDLSDWQVYNPTAKGQEFVADSPEPATMVLFGFGLVAVGFMRRKVFVG